MEVKDGDTLCEISAIPGREPKTLVRYHDCRFEFVFGYWTPEKEQELRAAGFHDPPRPVPRLTV